MALDYLRGQRSPDFRGGGIVNLLSSIIQARGGQSLSLYPDLNALPPAEIAAATNIVLLVIDGLGDRWLTSKAPDGVLSRYRRGAMTSVFPATTAAAITTFLTGDAPLQHGLTGWHTWLGELGCVMTVLPGTPRFGGVPYRRAGVDPVKLFGHRSVFDRIATRGIAVSPSHIATSDFNLAHSGRGEVLPFVGLRQMFQRAARALREDRQPKYLYLYWPGLDSIGHEKGIDSAAAQTHLRTIELALTDFLVLAAGTDTLLLVTGDHGQIDTTPDDCIDLADHPRLADCLALPLCGEPRAAFCYVRARCAETFESYCRQELGDRVDLIPSQELMHEELFGFGEPHPRFIERIGDYCILPKGNRLIRQWLPLEKRYGQVGVHGGLTEDELMVPLCLMRC